MIFTEADDFEIYWGPRCLGRFMVNSVAPYEVDIEYEYKLSGCDAQLMLDKLLDSGIIVPFLPNYVVELGMFDDTVEITKN